MRTRLMKALSLLALVFSLGFNQVVAAEWGTDYHAARAQAKAENKLVLLNFTGSDWCGGCIRLKEEVFSTSAFAEYASKHFVLVEVDFPVRKKLPASQAKANKWLEENFKVGGYPTVVIADAEGKIVGMEEGYTPGSGPEKYLKLLEAIARKAGK